MLQLRISIRVYDPFAIQLSMAESEISVEAPAEHLSIVAGGITAGAVIQSTIATALAKLAAAETPEA